MGKIVDLTGQKFGRLTVVSLHAKRDDWGRAMWDCRCDCGEKGVFASRHLLSGGSQSCKCYKRETASKKFLKDLSGMRFGRWVVLEDGGRDKSGRTLWLCECVGSQKSPHPAKQRRVLASSLNRGASLSCGCLGVECTQRANTKYLGTVAIQEWHGSLSTAARKAKVTRGFLSQVASGQKKCNKTYHRVRREVLGDATPDGRSKRDMYCVVCDNIVESWPRSKLRKGIEPHCVICAEWYAQGRRHDRTKAALPDLSVKTTARRREPRRNRETAEIARIVKEAVTTIP